MSKEAPLPMIFDPSGGIDQKAKIKVQAIHVVSAAVGLARFASLVSVTQIDQKDYIVQAAFSGLVTFCISEAVLFILQSREPN